MARNTLDFSSTFQREHPTAIIMPSSPFPLTLHHHHYPLTTPSSSFIIIHQTPDDLHHHQQQSRKPEETAGKEEEEEEEEEEEVEEDDDKEEDEEGFAMRKPYFEVSIFYDWRVFSIRGSTITLALGESSVSVRSFARSSQII